MAGASSSTTPGWDAWLQDALGELKTKQLLRTLRPTVWCNSSSEALIHRADLEAWAAGQEPVVRHYDHCGGLRGSAAAFPPHVRAGQPAVAASASGSSSGGVSGSSSSSSHELDLVPLKLFSLNDYLGLASHPHVAAAAARCANQLGLGPRSSALVAGYTHSHRQLEEALAALKGTQDCLLFPTGFAANLAVMTALGSSEDVDIFSDELNHASIIDGARLACRSGSSASAEAAARSAPAPPPPRQRLHVYRHNDLAHLEQLMEAADGAAAAAGRRRASRKLVATDSLFSMDGDFADLQGLVALKRRHGFLLAVDEAHATLVCGEHGGGAAEAMGVAQEVDLHVGTLSKAFGSLGGFVATSSACKSLLLNRGRAIIYSTALPLPVVEAAAAALRVSSSESWRRTHVWGLVERLGRGLGVPALSPVVPLVVGGEEAALGLSARLLRAGMHVPAIRPPTVPAGTCRLRVSLSAAHSEADVDALVALVRASGVQLATLAHLTETRAALPAGWEGRGTGSAPLLPDPRGSEVARCRL